MIQAEVFAASPGRMSGHGHADWHLCAVLAGAFEERLARTSTICRAGDMRISRPGARHALEFDSSGADCLILEASGSFWTGVLARMVASGRAHAFRQSAPGTLRALKRAAETTDLTRRLSALMELGPALAGPGGAKQPSWVSEAHAVIAASGGQIALTPLAASFKLARADFARGFQNQYGFRPVEFRALHRMRAALDLLQAGAPLAETALDAGYAHQSHMSNSIKAILGVTPAAVASSPILQDVA